MFRGDSNLLVSLVRLGTSSNCKKSADRGRYRYTTVERPQPSLRSDWRRQFALQKASKYNSILGQMLIPQYDRAWVN